jgi:hypothetical protein
LPCRSPAATRTPAANEITAHVYSEMSMFPKASLTGRVVRSNNTMRMAKSWGHSGGPVPEGAKPRFETIATIMRALNVGFQSRAGCDRAKKARKLTGA